MIDRRVQFAEEMGCYEYETVIERNLENTPEGRRFHRWQWCLDHMAENKPAWFLMESMVWSDWYDEASSPSWTGWKLAHLNRPTQYTDHTFKRPYDEHPLLHDNEWTEY